MSESILLDTHVWIWLVNGDKSLAPRSFSLIEKAAAQGQVFLSSISPWEVAMLAAKQRITLGNPCLDWIRNALAITGIQLLPLMPEIAVESAHLPGDFHGDPADRIIVATARIENCLLMTKDKNILNYGKQHYIQSISA